MSHRPRPTSRRRWWVLGITGCVLIATGVTAAVWPAGDDVRSSVASEVLASAPRAAATPDPSAVGSWSEPLGIPADATDDERLQIKLSYDLVAVPAAQFDRLRTIPGVDIVSPRTLDDTVYAAVRDADVAAVRAALPDVEVTPNKTFEADDAQTPVPSWGLDAVDNTDAARDDNYLYDSTGAGVTAFVLDSGVQSDHPDFGGRVDAAAGHDEVGDGRGTEDCNGHGTHVAGTIGSTTYGVAKAVRIVPVRVIGCGQGGSVLDMLYGMLWIYQNNAPEQSVVNMSVGSPTVQQVNDFADGLTEAGFVVVVAAGNDSQDACNTSPAGAAQPLTVGAFDTTRTLAWYSNWGSCVDILAPGSDITSTWIGSQVSTISGTSMASPHVAGLAARLLERHPTWTTTEVQQELTRATATGHIAGLPAGTPNLVAAIPGTPRIASLSVTADPAGLALAWTTNRIGAFSTFALTVVDTTTGQEYPVTVSATRSSIVFTDAQSGHAYTASVVGTATMPSGAVVTTDPVTATGP
ncbi:subtilisin family serine protease [Microbacterium sp. SORGH_AS 1204]|uniref:S8 family peptidase n=1 Tax=Microbacterium sp. SORGH_AS_1204 TaxID=3041785 RepID=UPI0027927E95|nr:S8 family peptidase [Microbacterium sp. SORGH_AS_1204]MDQ1137288.1 subtilisin family serine protease [Microbacterium sp. SORGH_AS_1204]